MQLLNVYILCCTLRGPFHHFFLTLLRKEEKLVISCVDYSVQQKYNVSIISENVTISVCQQICKFSSDNACILCKSALYLHYVSGKLRNKSHNKMANARKLLQFMNIYHFIVFSLTISRCSIAIVLKQIHLSIDFCRQILKTFLYVTTINMSYKKDYLRRCGICNYCKVGKIEYYLLGMTSQIALLIACF